MKAHGLKLANALAVLWRFVPQRVRLLGRDLPVCSWCRTAGTRCEWLYGNGEHPSKLTRYHDFSVEPHR